MAAQNASQFTIGEVSLTNVWTCVKLPPDINSPGIGPYLVPVNDGNKYSILNFTMPILELQIAAIFVIAITIHHFLFKRLGMPVITAHLIAGLIIGPMAGTFKITHATELSVQVLGPAAALGYAFFLFLSAVKMDVRMVKRAGNMAISIGVLSVLIPLIAGAITLNSLVENTNFYKHKIFLLTVTYSLTSFPVIVSLLSDLKILNSELGRLGLSSAVVGDLLGLFLFTGAAILKIGVEVTAKQARDDLWIIITFFLVVLLVLRPAMLWIVRNTPEGRPVKDIYIYIVILFFLMTVSLSRYFGQFLIFGPFILGLAVPDGPPLGSALVEKFDSMVNGFFLPLFVATCAMRVTFGSNDITWSANATVAIVTLVTKFVVSLLLTVFCKMPITDAVALALIMSAKGIVEMGWYSFLSDSKLMPDAVFSFVAIFIIVLASIVPVLVKYLYDPSRKYAGYRIRNIMNSKFDAELQILACIHVPNNVTSVINLLEASCPTRESPIAVNVVHLIKLSGQATPLFISHQTQQKTLSNRSYSENVILSFQQFERNNWGAVSINPFTAITPPNLMHDDICTLALDKLSSLIILPFHRRWYIDGSIESDDHAIMTLNCSVLERAPCSVGILIDRGHLRRPISNESSSSEASCNVAMIFLGGNDDREALTFAKRMTQDTRVKLTISHLYATRSGDDASWDHMLDSEVLRDVKDNGYVRYIEEEVNDGHITASILRGMVNDYDLIIVGRRYDLETPQTTGLKEWSEFPELGVIGDLLASSDCSGKCSVLIVQQQQTTERTR